MTVSPVTDGAPHDHAVTAVPLFNGCRFAIYAALTVLGRYGAYGASPLDDRKGAECAASLRGERPPLKPHRHAPQA